jgi:Putative peptidoglycan binding domain
VHATIHKAGDALAGRGMWIWEISQSDGGTLSSIISTARTYGVSTLMIKSADGPTMWSQFNSQVVRALHSAGLRVCAWQYVYGNHPLLEADVAAEAVHDGADCLIIDAESEYEGKYVAAQVYLTQLRKLIGANYPVALAGFPYVDYHPGFPYSVFLGPGGAQLNAPQMYWLDIGTTVTDVYVHTYTYNDVYQRQIDPLGQVWDNPPAGQIIRFRQLSRTYGAPGVSWWDWQAANTGGWRAISVGAGNLTGVAPVASTPILGLGAQGDLVVWAQEHLITAGYPTTVDGGYGPLTQAAVQSFQTAHGLTADGIVGPETWGALLRFAPAKVTWTDSGAYVASAGAVRSARAGHTLVLRVPKSARLPARRDEIAGAGGAG